MYLCDSQGNTERRVTRGLTEQKVTSMRTWVIIDITFGWFLNWFGKRGLRQSFISNSLLGLLYTAPFGLPCLLAKTQLHREHLRKIQTNRENIKIFKYQNWWSERTHRHTHTQNIEPQLQQKHISDCLQQQQKKPIFYPVKGCQETVPYCLNPIQKKKKSI